MIVDQLKEIVEIASMVLLLFGVGAGIWLIILLTIGMTIDAIKSIKTIKGDK